MISRKITLYAILLLVIDIAILIYMINDISIYYKEAIDVVLNDSLQAQIANISLDFFHIFFSNNLLNDFFARFPFLIFHILSCILLYLISLDILRKKHYAIIALILFMAMPGISIQAILISKATIITFMALLISYLQIRFNHNAYILFIVAIFLDQSSAVLFLALFFYALITRNNFALIFSMICFGMNMYIFTPIRGMPHAFLLETVGTLAILFSPVLFIYYCYSIYNNAFNKHIQFITLIPLVGIIFTLLLSLRQAINAQSFMPLLAIAMPIMVAKLMSDIAIRLPYFRKMYKARLFAIAIFLIMENIILFGNKLTYLINPHFNFAYSFYGAKDLAKSLHKLGIENIFVDDNNLAIRLKFYGIDTSTSTKLVPSYDGDINIVFLGVKIASYKIIQEQH